MNLYTLARTVNTISAIVRGRPGTRAKNIVVGRTLARAGFWRRLWGPWWVAVLVLAFASPAHATPADCVLPCISFSGDVKPLPWHLYSVFQGKQVAV